MRERSPGGRGCHTSRISGALMLLGSVCLSGCGRYALDEGAYNALQGRECLQQAGMPSCAEQQRFEDYRRARRSVLGHPG